MRAIAVSAKGPIDWSLSRRVPREVAEGIGRCDVPFNFEPIAES